MSRMSDVNVELHELGVIKVRTIENEVNAHLAVYGRKDLHKLVTALQRKYGVASHTAVMLVSGAPKKTCSRILDEHDQGG